MEHTNPALIQLAHDLMPFLSTIFKIVFVGIAIALAVVIAGGFNKGE